MNVLIDRLINVLQNIIVSLQEKLPKKRQEATPINNLAPKILTDPADLQKVQPYLDNLEKAVNAEGINNIAITGSYGSGKSTILKTFQHQKKGKEYQYLNLSLASFKDNKEGKEGSERQLEISLLQQMFYHVKPSQIPDSRFKRIINVSSSKLVPLILFIVSWIFSGLFLFKFRYIESLNPHLWNLNYEIDWVAVLSSIILFVGVGWIIKNLYRLFANSRVNKLNIKGELELGGSDNSVFNKHLEEILYFFERTKFNIVVIEDVDRFNSTDIFTKLREINILLNNSELINRPIKFLYAIRDEIFTDKTERVKFFEFIIPIIPFINPSNANDQLQKLISNANLQGVLSDEFTSDIVTFIDDIDMRLLINIFQEYQVYRNTLDDSLSQDNLFAILVYKNLDPEDFGNLARREGKLYTFLTQKDLYISNLRNELDKEIKERDLQIKLLEAEVIKPIEELRAVYINKLIPLLTQFHCFDLNGKEISVVQAVEDEYFDELKKGLEISYYQYRTHPNRFQVIYQSQSSTVKLSDIEKEVSSLTYLQREKLLLDRSNNQLEILKLEKIGLRNRISELENLSVKEIFELIEINDHLSDFENSHLMGNMLLNGYIDEHFEDYISLFHEVSLTKSDFAFERNVKAGISSEFDYELSKTENIIKRLPDKYFLREEILNYSLLTCLLDNIDKYENKLSNFFKCLKAEGQNQFDFINGFLAFSDEKTPSFTRLLCAHKSNLWLFLNTKSDLPDNEIRGFIKRVFEYANLEDINKFDDLESLTKYFEELPDPFAFFGSFNDIKNLQEFITLQKVRFSNLDVPTENQNQLFQLIYSKNHYQINKPNIQAIIKGNNKGVDLDQLQKAHYTTLLSLNLRHLNEYINSNIEEYISNVMTFMKDNNEESEETILNILNKEEVSLKLKEAVLDSQNSVIKSINDIEDLDVKQSAIRRNKILPNWENVFDYYEEVDEENSKSFDELLIDFLNTQENYKELSKRKLNEFGRVTEFVNQISSKLLSCHELSDAAYKELLSSLPHTYKSIRYADYKPQRLEILLEQGVLSFSPENFEGLKSVDSKLSLRLVEDKQQTFKTNFTELSLDSDDWLSILKSQKMSDQYKIDLVQMMGNDIIIDNDSIARIVSEILPDDKYIPIDYNVLEAMFVANKSIEKRVALLNLHFSNLTNDQIRALTEKLGGDYKYIFLKQHKPTFPNTTYNLKFFEKLQDQDLIIRYEIKEKRDVIKVFALY